MNTTRASSLLLASTLLAGCGFQGAYSLNLPGGADIGDDPYTIQVEFLDVLDLVQQSGVRVADVPVGRVEKIELGNEWTAVVTLTVNGNVRLPENAVAAVQQTSLLGEKFIELAAPGNETARGQLEDGDRIPLARTNRNIEVEELLGALSLFLNGGGLAQLQTINKELADALQGREEKLKTTLRELDTFVGGLDEQKTEIVRTIENVNNLAGTLAERTETIETALDTIGPGLEILNQQRELLVQMLEGLARLGDVSTRLITQAGAATVEDLQLLQPILAQLAAAEGDLGRALPLLLTYPFPDSSLTALNYREAQTGGYALFTNMTAVVDLDLTNLFCRYVIDPATGGVELLNPEELTNGCNVPNVSGQSTPSAAAQGIPVPGLGDIVGELVDETAQAAGEATENLPGTPALPNLPEVLP